jgi:predicted transcriptional regulator
MMVCFRADSRLIEILDAEAKKQALSRSIYLRRMVEGYFIARQEARKQGVSKVD